MAVTKKVSARLKREKNCKSCVRFNAVDENDAKVLLTIYIVNDAMKKLGNPDGITVSIEANDEK